jgi:hypothetical protein
MTKVLLKILGFSFVLSILTSACQSSPTCSNVVSEVKSSYGLSALVCDTTPDGFGATVGTVRTVYVVLSGERPQAGDAVLSTESANAIRAEWRNDSNLFIEVQGGYVTSFRGFWLPKEVKPETKRVRVGIKAE